MALNIQRDVALAPLTTLKIGGPAKVFMLATSEDDVADAMAFAYREGLDVFVLGGGSNVLISDEGFDGLVLQTGIKGVKQNGENLVAGAGEDWDDFVERCVRDGLAGLECMSGIPGFVGGTPVQNVGAYGQEVADTISSVRCYDREADNIVELMNRDCGFTYRTSIFNTTHRDRYIVLSVTYSLEKGGAPKTGYRDLKEMFVDMSPSLRHVRNAVVDIRRKKSMVIDPADPNSRSAGSFFKNPIVDGKRLEQIESQTGAVPYFEFGEQVKIPAAWLIEKAGFPKGFVLANAGISSNHTLAIINRGSAKAADIIALKDMIQGGVRETFGIELVPEPVFVGF